MITETEKTEQTSKKIEELPYEFILYINDNIICQRYFNIRDFNEDVLKSYELKELMDNIVGMNNGEFGSLGIIPKYLQNKSKVYLWDNYNPYFTQKEETTKNIFDKIDNFQFEIKINKVTVAKSQFCGNYFPPKVRYAVDVREIIPSIMSEIRNYFSQKNYTLVGAN
jgi:hypothetical protein